MLLVHAGGFLTLLHQHQFFLCRTGFLNQIYCFKATI